MLKISPRSSNLYGPNVRKFGIAARYALAILAAVAALLLRQFLSPLLGQHNVYHTAWLAVVFSAWYCGLGPSAVTVIVTAVGIWYWFLPPTHSFAVKEPTDAFGLFGFLLFSGVVIALGEMSRRTVLKRLRAEDKLRQTQAELEQRVRERTASLQERTAEVYEKATLLDLANDAIFIKTAGGTISYWNKGAERLYGWTRSEAIGRIPAELLLSRYPIPLQEIESRSEWEGEISQVTRDGKPILVASRWTTLRDPSGVPKGWMEINTDITDRKQAEDAARSLSGRLLTLQDDERRRIARGLHDSLGQYLAALKMQIDLHTLSNRKEAEQLAESAEILDRCLTETRTISHLLHPPLLDEAGFGSAARWYVDGFSQRSGIKVNLVLPAELARLSDEVEITLFRTMQEALTNVHRHSGAAGTDIQLTLDAKWVRLEIQDNGIGIRPEALKRIIEGAAETGIGIAGMRERARELGGSLEVKCNAKGTLVAVTLPLSHAVEMKAGRREREPSAA